jgi:deazaflavin-dependent oxidoreductase (nitroreductase family)
MTEENSASDAAQWIAHHIQVYLEDPERGHMWDYTPIGGPGVLATLLLTTTGRKSGEQRHAPLLYGRDGDGFITVASKGGSPTHPAWFLNLLAHPQCEIRVGEQRHQVTARVTDGAERSRLWNVMAGIYPPYNDYQAATDREIPIVVLENT